ncbi:guanine deaminase [Leptidea sinapis]|uniref:Guanine deaminase n=1 Tax=Leptidea sinapis TaxID=189913 RepID=A0A5E4QZ78_9NEOP|nr:guanine deaminase [Leptidea sinapis]VVD03711.1 unnamed protein product [Leptidea sinapis]
MPQKVGFLGFIAYSVSLNELVVFNGYLTVESGVITRMGLREEFESLKYSGSLSGFNIKYMGTNQILIPGFVDCHTHAPQFPNIGLGLDKPLMEWLDKYTFPLERRYSDLQFAADVYTKVVKGLLKNGTTTVCYFGSLHLKGTLELVNSVIKCHQRALVGKVSMNMPNSAGYYNDTAKELKDTEDFVRRVREKQRDLVQPVVTPRFAVSCDTELMTGLAKIATRYACRIQSHISEHRDEVEYVLKTNPNCTSYSDVYDKCNILNNQSIMAHAIHLTDDEIKLFAAKGVSVAHCPASNTRLRSGMCPVRKLLDNNIKVGLGTDISGGDNATLLDAMRRTMDVSTHLEFHGGRPAINWKEAFYLATLGGAKVLGLDDKIGNFKIGKEFDALVVDIYADDSQLDNYDYPPEASDEERILNLLHRFLYVGDDRNIVEVYVKGKQLMMVVYDEN